MLQVLSSIVKMDTSMSRSALDSLGHLRPTTRLRLIRNWCLRGMITNLTFVNIVDGFEDVLNGV